MARLSAAARHALLDGDVRLFVSAITAFEYEDLNRRGRFRADLPLAPMLLRLKAELVPFPTDAWQLIPRLPDLHRDPIDRMLIAHAIHAGLTLVTADAIIRRYPVATLW